MTVATQLVNLHMARATFDHLGHMGSGEDRVFFIDNLLVRIHVIIEMILVDRPCVMGL